MTITTETTTTDKATVIAVVRSEHYAARRYRLTSGACYVSCVCGAVFPDDSDVKASLCQHMVAMLGHRPQAVEIDRETGAMTIVCTCGDQPPMVTDGSAWDLHRVHVEFLNVKPLVPAQGGQDAPPAEMFPYSVTLPASVVQQLTDLFAARRELIVKVGGRCYFTRAAIEYLMSFGADAMVHACNYPAGAHLHIGRHHRPNATGPYRLDGFPMTYRLV